MVTAKVITLRGMPTAVPRIVQRLEALSYGSPLLLGVEEADVDDVVLIFVKNDFDGDIQAPVNDGAEVFTKGCSCWRQLTMLIDRISMPRRSMHCRKATAVALSLQVKSE